MLLAMHMINSVCARAVEVALLLFFVLVLLAPVHATFASRTTGNAAVAIVEIAVIAGAIALYIFVLFKKKRSPFIVFGEWFYALPLPRRALWWLVNILAGIPFIWFIGKLPLYLGAYALELAIRYQLHSGVDLSVAVDPLLPYVWTALAVLYYGFLVWKQTSPILAFWNLISYKGAGVVKKVSWQRGLVLWALHLIIVYVFARTLIGFFWADLAAAHLIGYPQTLDEFFDVSQYLVWALTVLGCLLGYGYSVVSILWGQFIRMLDFTVVGWLTNLFCYPLLGVVIWHMVPSFVGPSSIITSGPLLYLMLSLGLVLNLLYMFSIWNLGTKFDLMADKGVRTAGFYSVIRHPNYMLEACMLFTLYLSGLTTSVEWLAISMVFFLYWIRAEREDNFMTYSNPDYTPYRVATPYKFIPGIY